MDSRIRARSCGYMPEQNRDSLLLSTWNVSLSSIAMIPNIRPAGGGEESLKSNKVLFDARL